MGGSEGNQMNDGTGFQPSEPGLCANGCGFFGSASTMNLCSKCFNSFRLEEEQAAAAKAAFDKVVNPTQSEVAVPESSSSSAVVVKATSPSEPVVEESGVKKPSNRCFSCNKKVGVMGFACRCGCTFCGTHRYPEQHDCTFDFKGQGLPRRTRLLVVIKFTGSELDDPFLVGFGLGAFCS